MIVNWKPSMNQPIFGQFKAVNQDVSNTPSSGYTALTLRNFVSLLFCSCILSTKRGPSLFTQVPKFLRKSTKPAAPMRKETQQNQFKIP